MIDLVENKLSLRFLSHLQNFNSVTVPLTANRILKPPYPNPCFHPPMKSDTKKVCSIFIIVLVRRCGNLFFRGPFYSFQARSPSESGEKKKKIFELFSHTTFLSSWMNRKSTMTGLSAPFYSCFEDLPLNMG